MEELNWEEIKAKLQKSIKLEKNEKDLSVKIIVLEPNIQDDQIVGNMLKNEAEMKQSLTQFLGKKKLLDCDIKINQPGKNIKLTFRDKTDFTSVYNLLNDMFFGDYFKEMVEALKGAFGESFGSGDFKL